MKKNKNHIYLGDPLPLGYKVDTEEEKYHIRQKNEITQNILNSQKRTKFKNIDEEEKESVVSRDENSAFINEITNVLTQRNEKEEEIIEIDLTSSLLNEVNFVYSRICYIHTNNLQKNYETDVLRQLYEKLKVISSDIKQLNIKFDTEVSETKTNDFLRLDVFEELNKLQLFQKKNDSYFFQRFYIKKQSIIKWTFLVVILVLTIFFSRYNCCVKFE